MSSNQPSTQTNYRARLTLNASQGGDHKTTVKITSNDRSHVQQLISSLIQNDPKISLQQRNNPVRFDEADQGRTTVVFHNSYQNGQEPLGWIRQEELPESMPERSQARRAA